MPELRFRPHASTRGSFRNFAWLKSNGQAVIMNGLRHPLIPCKTGYLTYSDIATKEASYYPHSGDNFQNE
jgi:hypothetical protein